MSSSISKRKERSGRDGNRRKRGECSNQTSKDNNNNGGNNSSKGRYRKNNKKSTDRSKDSSTSDTSGRYRNRRRKKQVKATESHEENQKPDMNVQGRRKQRSRKRNHKRKASPASETVMSLESSSSHMPVLVNSHGSTPISSNSSHVSPMEYDNLPWANLDVPMDLSLVELEINDQGVDFDLQAQKNHMRWLANLEKEKNINLKKTAK